MITVHLLPALVALSLPGTSQSVLRTSDVTDVTGARELTALAASLPAGGSEALDALAAVERRGEEVAARGAALVDSVRRLVAPPLDAKTQTVALLADGRLAILASPEQHAWIDGMLAGLRAHAGERVDVEATVFELPAGTLAALPHPVVHGELLDEESAARLRHELAVAGAAAVASPHLVTLPARAADLSIVRKISFVRDHVPHAIGEETVLVPTLDTVEDGLRIEVCAAPTAADRLVLSVKVDVSDVVEPIPSFETTLGGESEVPLTFQLPEVVTVRADARFELPREGRVVLALEQGSEREVVLLVRAALTPGVERR